MGKELNAELCVKYLPSSPMADRLYRLFPSRSNPLEPLVAALNGDADFSAISHELRSGKDSFQILTPRFRVRFFADRHDRSTVILTGIEAVRPERWASDRKTGTACRILWTTTPNYENTTRDTMLDVVRASSNASVRATPFWDFWSDLLDKDQQEVDDLRSHPGWRYSGRRVGISGEIELECDEAEDLFAQCSGSFLVQQVRADGQKDDKERYAFLQTTTAPSAGRLSALSREKNIIAQLPKQGTLRLDWISAAADLKRRRTTLDRLLKGEAALPGLKDMLPNGPTDAREPGVFTAILDKVYNEDQQNAIGKALAEGTVTCILGPPGTGKTSVIAEIAMQMTQQGKRVLISSQTNLAVDNALERLATQTSIFPVRLGRIEAVKLSPVLHIDAAAKRYQNLLLSRSHAAEVSMLSQVDGCADLPSEEEFGQWLIAWQDRVQLEARAQTLQQDLHFKGARYDEAKAAKADAATRMRQVCAQAGIKEGDGKSLVAVVDRLKDQDVDIAELVGERLRIGTALKRTPAVNALLSEAEQLATMSKTARATDLEITRHTGRLGKTALRKTELEEAKRFNEALEKKRAKAGFWAGLWSGLTESPKDLAPLERELASATRLEREAESTLPSLRTRLATERKAEAASTTAWNLAYRSTFGESPTSSIASEAAGLKKVAELGAALKAAKGTEFLDALQHSALVSSTDASLKRTEARATKAETALQEAAALAATASHELAQHPDPTSDIQAVMGMLRVPPENISEEVLETLKQAVGRRQALLRSLPPIQEALQTYRERLNQPTLDLQRAMIAEADVVGATCSGIAGAKDFDADFDCVIVDEAGRTNPLELVMAVVRGKSIVLVGDHKQLPPFVSDAVRRDVSDSDRDYLESSIFETIYNSSQDFGRTAALHKQYRMAPPICDIVTSISYQDTPLVTAGPALERIVGTASFRSVHWVRPLGSKNRAIARGTGLVNEAETQAALAVLKRLRVAQASRAANRRPYCVGMISMYKQQAYAIGREAASYKESGVFEVEVGTVDSFQGREMDAVILTFSETNPQVRRFFYDRRRLNVALSRAKEHLVIVGSLDQLGGRSMAFDQPNPLYELRLCIERGVATGMASKESFDA